MTGLRYRLAHASTQNNRPKPKHSHTLTQTQTAKLHALGQGPDLFTVTEVLHRTKKGYFSQSLTRTRVIFDLNSIQLKGK